MWHGSEIFEKLDYKEVLHAHRKSLSMESFWNKPSLHTRGRAQTEVSKYPSFLTLRMGNRVAFGGTNQSFSL